MSYNHYIALVGKIVRATETLPDEPGGLSLQNLMSRTDHVKSSVHRILQSLRRHGYIEQGATGAAFLAAPVFDSRERVRGSISVGGPKERFSPAFAEDLILYLLDARRRLSKNLSATGYVHPYHGEFTLIVDTK